MRLLFSTLIFIILASIVPSGFGHPKATDRAERWQLHLDTNDLRYYRDRKTGEGYWVLVYEVTNETDKDRNWIPNFVLATDRGGLLSDGENVPRQVQLAILDTFGDAWAASPIARPEKCLEPKKSPPDTARLWPETPSPEKHRTGP